MPETTSKTGIGGGLGLYIHWPFCLTKCPYCDFNTHQAAAIDHKRWAEMYGRAMTEMARRSGRLGARLDSIFIGGGTPSLMTPQTVKHVIDTAKGLFACTSATEITMEANPTSVEAGRLEAFADAGIGRLSLGMQALDDAGLAALGRNHSKGEALAALNTAQAIFPRLSADFIYGRPKQGVGQEVAGWRDELAQILDLGLHHLSLYQLTLEPGTAFFSRHKRGLMRLPDDDMGRALYDVTMDMTTDAGLPGYEISNHASRGHECRHNLNYWRGGDWLGIGPGAYGRYWDGGVRIETRSRRHPAAWLDDVAWGGTGVDLQTTDTPFEAASEIIMMGLRLREGVDTGRLENLPGYADDWLDRGAIQGLVAAGLIRCDGTGLSLTAAGRPVINAVIGHLLGGKESLS